MVNVSEKPITKRTAVAKGRITIGPEAFNLIQNPSLSKKGDILNVARIAGIMGAKKTAILIPLCHNLFLDSVCVDMELEASTHSVVVMATATCSGKTGVEMEALAAVSIATLTIYDMVKSVAKGAIIQEIRLVEKTGGVSGVFRST